MSERQESALARFGEYMVSLVLRALIGLAGLLPYRWRIPRWGG